MTRKEIIREITETAVFLILFALVVIAFFLAIAATYEVEYFSPK